MTARAAAAVVDRKAIVIKQMPAKLDLLRGDRIGLRYRGWRKAGRQLPIESGLRDGGASAVPGNGRTRSYEQCCAPNETESPPAAMN